ncbi:hypothetical protein LTR36_010457 [Oleoguttula mirabilis]|uniref:Uncharacterized protein n=1 Tax=Oleoguttula mirabilis TaxID=1507867 RepID=A0AAV9J4W8_9PEZI|nr:hypothetical protein LTR36_010457 [Oleoguttula mirabilis]
MIPRINVHSSMGGFGHPLIQLTDAFELANANAAVEALALTAVDYNPLARLIDLHQTAQHSKPGAGQALAILQQIHHDSRLNRAFASPGVQNTSIILRSETNRKVMLGYIESLDFSDTAEEAAESDLHELTKVAVLLLCTVSRHSKSLAEMQRRHKFDFYLTHQLTFCWSLRVLVPYFPKSARSRLFRSEWLLMVLAYLHQQLPCIKPDILEQTPLLEASFGTEWHRLRDTALGSTKDRGYDPHFVKVLRTLWEFSRIWREDEQMFLEAAVRFECEFDGWTGYGKEGEEKMDVAT